MIDFSTIYSMHQISSDKLGSTAGDLSDESYQERHLAKIATKLEKVPSYSISSKGACFSVAHLLYITTSFNTKDSSKALVLSIPQTNKCSSNKLDTLNNDTTL